MEETVQTAFRRIRRIFLKGFAQFRGNTSNFETIFSFRCSSPFPSTFRLQSLLSLRSSSRPLETSRNFSSSSSYTLKPSQNSLGGLCVEKHFPHFSIPPLSSLSITSHKLPLCSPLSLSRHISSRSPSLPLSTPLKLTKHTRDFLSRGRWWGGTCCDDALRAKVIRGRMCHLVKGTYPKLSKASVRLVHDDITSSLVWHELG